MNIRKRLWPCLLVSGIPFSACLPAAAAVFTVTESFWGNATTTNSFAWALNQANTTPGSDTIRLQLTSGNTINVDAATPVSSSFLSQITESVQIQGNGVTLVGNPSFVTTGGTIYTKTLIPSANPSPPDVLVRPAFSFAEIAPNLSVGINGLNLDGLNGYISAGVNSVVAVANSAIKNSVAYGFGARPVFEALSGSTLELKNVILDKINPLANNQLGPAWFGAIQGVNATLAMANSVIQGSSTSVGAINWVGGLANVVSSVITGDAGGLSIDGPGSVLNFVNSLFSPSGTSSTARIQAKDGGVANLIASTIQADQLFINTELDCATSPSWYGCNGSPLQAYDQGVINLSQSIVSTINADLNGNLNPYSETYLAFPAGNLTADLLSYVQPTPTLDPSALQALFNQPGLLTGAIPYALTNGGLYGDLPEGAYLVPGSPLRSAIADADGVNQLRSPIDGSVIDTDVYGNPRTAYGFRDIGAVQSTQEVPGPLPALGLAAAFRWSRRLRRTVRAGRR